MNTNPPSSPRNFPLLLIGQFLSAFGDNFLLAAILAPLTYDLNLGKASESVVNGENALFAIFFALPSILLAPVAGFLNDRMPKTQWLIGGNLIKLIGTAVGFAGVAAFATHSHTLQVVGYTIVGVGACIYAPAKYGILPEVVANERLVKANGWVEMLTLVAIVGGLGGGAVLYDATLSLRLCYVASVALYAAAFGFNAFMKATPFNSKASVNRSVVEFLKSFWGLVSNPRLGRILLGSALFWFAGSALKNGLQSWGLAVFAQAHVEHITNTKLVALKVGMVVGIVLGVAMAGFIHRTGDLSWARRYAFLLAAGFVALGVLGGRYGIAACVIALIVTGAAAGLLVVPFNAALQSETDPTKLGKTVSIQSLTDYIGIFAGAGYLLFLSRFDLMALPGMRALQVTPSGAVLIVLGATVAAITFALRMVVRPRAV